MLSRGLSCLLADLGISSVTRALPVTGRRAKYARNVSLAAIRAPSTQPIAFVSQCTDPYLNLSFEDWLFRRSAPDIPVLLLYRNSPCVVIGRNQAREDSKSSSRRQNPWKEIDLHRLRKIGAVLVRRRSGGGTVYHDLGNTNYCMFTAKEGFQRRTAASMVMTALRTLQIPAYLSQLPDICVEQYKVSGSAFKLSNRRAYHHGTMLIEAKLHDLHGLLGTSHSKLVSKGVASVPSAVRNLDEWSSLIDHDSFVDAVVKEFDKFCRSQDLENVSHHSVTQDDMLALDEVRKGSEELKTWEWQFGQTPEFTNELEYQADWGSIVRVLLIDSSHPQAIKLASRHGLITSVDIEADTRLEQKQEDELVEGLRSALVNSRYGSMNRAALDGVGQQVANWLDNAL